MKNLFYLVLLAVIVTSCGESAKKAQDDVPIDQLKFEFFGSWGDHCYYEIDFAKQTLAVGQDKESSDHMHENFRKEVKLQSDASNDFRSAFQSINFTRSKEVGDVMLDGRNFGIAIVKGADTINVHCLNPRKSRDESNDFNQEYAALESLLHFVIEATPDSEVYALSTDIYNSHGCKLDLIKRGENPLEYSIWGRANEASFKTDSAFFMAFIDHLPDSVPILVDENWLNVELLELAATHKNLYFYGDGYLDYSYRLFDTFYYEADSTYSEGAIQWLKDSICRDPTTCFYEDSLYMKHSFHHEIVDRIHELKEKTAHYYPTRHEALMVIETDSHKANQ